MKLNKNIITVIVILLISIVYYQFFLEQKYYHQLSKKYQGSIEIIFLLLIGAIGYLNLHKQTNWIRNIWIIIYFFSTFFFIILFVVDNFIYSFSGKVSFRFLNLKNFLISPLPFIILHYIANLFYKNKLK